MQPEPGDQGELVLGESSGSRAPGSRHQGGRAAGWRQAPGALWGLPAAVGSGQWAVGSGQCAQKCALVSTGEHW